MTTKIKRKKITAAIPGRLSSTTHNLLDSPEYYLGQMVAVVSQHPLVDPLEGAALTAEQKLAEDQKLAAAFRTLRSVVGRMAHHFERNKRAELFQLTRN